MPKFIRPEFFDILGAGVFLFVVFVSARALITGVAVSHLTLEIILLLGIGGFLVDATIVYRTYLKKK